MDKGWIIEISQSERDFEDAGAQVEHRVNASLAEVEREYDRALKKYYMPTGPRKKEIKMARDRLKNAYREVEARTYRPWVPAYMFRQLPVEDSLYSSLKSDPWVQTKLYDILDFPCRTTTLIRCVELLKDVRHVYAHRAPNLRIRNVDTNEEMPTDWIIEA